MREALFAIAIVCSTLACSTHIHSYGDSPKPGDTSATDQNWQNSPLCPLCVTSDDCDNAVCAQFSGDTYCAPACEIDSDCSSDRSCQAVTTWSGEETSVCVPTADVCGPTVREESVIVDGGSQTCGTLVSPITPAACHCNPQLHQCDPDGCYGGWWCDTSNNTCHAPPVNCAQQDGGGQNQNMNMGSIGINGGTLASLEFAVIGDTRPPVINDTKGYPSAVITKIYAAIQAAKIPFAVSTGDYLFSSSNGGQSTPQLQMYAAARAKYSGVLFPAMGNHECTGATNSNCGPGTSTGTTKNFSDFLSVMLGPIQQTTPYYAVHVNGPNNVWTAKFVFVAGNAWTATQASWLDQALAQATTYTFVVRHEPKAATAAPGVNPSEQIMAKHPYTLAIVGHTHTYGKTGPKQVTIGNGGAPLTGGSNYGWGHVTQRQDGAIQVDMIDYQSGQPDTKFRFALKPDGSPAP
jgi:hypothetical protein